MSKTAKLTDFALFCRHTEEEGSHAGSAADSAFVRIYRGIRVLRPEELGCEKVHYTRIKKLADGSFIIIYNESRNGKNTMYKTSRDLISWSEPGFIFKSGPCISAAGEDFWCYSSPDAVVLKNGDILAFAAFRAAHAYSKHPETNGIIMSRSTDNGKSWSEGRIIYRGTTWEPSAIQLRSGEIHLYWTNCTLHHLEDNNAYSSTGSALLRSFDNGYTWTGDPEKTYTGQIVTQQKTELTYGVQLFNDQMPVAVELADGRGIALALETRHDKKGVPGSFTVSLSYTKDNWKTPLAVDEEGPADRKPNIFVGCAPYIVRFPSGETALSFNEGGKFHVLSGDAEARNFYTRIFPFDGFSSSGCWGSLEVIEPHLMLACFNDIYKKEDGVQSCNYCIAPVYLNNTVDVPFKTVDINAGPADWEGNYHALVAAGGSDTVASLRFAHDEKNLYVLLERQGENIAPEDETWFNLRCGTKSVRTDIKPDGGVICNSKEIKASFRSVSDGYYTAASFPLSLFDGDNPCVSLVACFKSEGKKPAYCGLSDDNPYKEIPLRLSFKSK